MWTPDIKRKQILLIAWGGIGDALVCTPAIRTLKELYPEYKLIIYHMGPKHEAVFKDNPYIDSLRQITTKNLLKHPRHWYTFYWNRKHMPYTYLMFQPFGLTHIYKKNVKHIVADIFDMELKTEKVEIYLTKEEEEFGRKSMTQYKVPVIIHVHARSTQNHHWYKEKWEQLVAELPEYDFIQLGNTDEALIDGANDWRGKTTIREAFAMVKYATSFVGIDSSMAHITNAFDTNGVVIFGSGSATIWGHENNINLSKGLPCQPCYYYLFKDKCIYDHECMTTMEVAEVKAALVSQVEKQLALAAS
jgi:ADP-heptose:LPS heptosyltransferase